MEARIRRKQRLLPTEEGRTFYREAEKALSAVDQIVDIARDIRTLKGAHLRMVAPMFIAFGILPAAIAKFRAAHPQTRISLEIKNIRDIADWVANGLFDMAVTPLPFDDARVETELFATGRAVVIMPKRHPLAAKRIVPLRDLRSESIVLPSIGTSTRTQCDGAFESVGLKPNCMIEATSAFFTCQLVARGLGLGLIDQFTFDLAAGLGLVARPIRPAIEFPLGFLFPSHRPRSALVSAFVLAVRSTVGSARLS